MKISLQNQFPYAHKNNNARRNDIKSGALKTGAFLNASAAASWGIRPGEMKEVVKEFGGRNKYIAKYIAALAALCAVGGLINTVYGSIKAKFFDK